MPAFQGPGTTHLGDDGEWYHWHPFPEDAGDNGDADGNGGTGGTGNGDDGAANGGDDGAGNGTGGDGGVGDGGAGDGGGTAESNPIIAIDLSGPIDGGVQVGNGDPDDGLITVDTNLPELSGLDLPGLPGVGDGPLAVADLDGLVDGDLQVGSGDPDDALITVNGGLPELSGLDLPGIPGVGDGPLAVGDGPLAFADLGGLIDGEVQVGSGDPEDALITVDGDLPELSGLGLPDIAGVGDDVGPLAFVDLSGPIDGDVVVGGGEDVDPANALITADLDLGDVGIVEDLAGLPVNIGGLGDLAGLPVDIGGLGDLLDVDLPV